MIVVNNEKYRFILYKREKNTPYEWQNVATLQFRGRPAGQFEKKQYRVQQGVNGGTDSIFIICSNLPSEVKIGDKITFLGKEWMVNSVGYYFDEAWFVNPSILTDDYIQRKCPKGINIG